MAANLDDGTAAPQLLSQVTAEELPRLSVIFADNKYHNHALNAWLAEHRPTWRIEVQSPPSGTKGSAWSVFAGVVERTNAWNGRSRRNSQDYERTTASSEARIQWSAIHLMLNRLAPPAQKSAPFKYRTTPAAPVASAV